MTALLQIDSAQAERDLATLADASKRCADFAHRLVEGLRDPLQLVALDRDVCPAAAATHVRMRAQLPKSLADLVAALRAGEFDFLIVEQAHGEGGSCDEC